MIIRPLSATLLLLLITSACDPTESGVAPAAPKPVVETRTPVAREPVALEPAAPAPVDPLAKAVVADPGPDLHAAYSSCLRACDDTKLAHPEKAACRFNCEQPAAGAPASADPAIVGSDPVQYVVDCIERCYIDGKRSDTCMSSCKSAVAALPTAPAASVLDVLGTCLDTCHDSKHVSDTNRATCGLNCTQAARIAGPAPGKR